MNLNDKELYIQQLEEENLRLKNSNKSLRTNNEGLLKGLTKLQNRLYKYEGESKKHSKAVILKTNKGVYLFGSIQSSNGAWFDAEGCFNYCIDTENREYHEKHQAFKLIAGATLLAHNPRMGELWYKDKDNFVDVEIPYEVNQKFPNVEDLLND